MRGFVLKLVEQLVGEGRPLSRNRHFDTFDDGPGRAALRTSRHLRALERDLLASAARGRKPLLTTEDREGKVVMRLEMEHLKARRVAFLSQGELAILLRRPGVREAIGEATLAELGLTG